MEIMARAARGRAAEVLGPAAYPFDELVRRLGIPAAAQASARSLPVDDLAILEPYAEGVLAADATAGPAPEHLALGIEQPWRHDVGSVLIDICGVALVRALGLSDAWLRRIVWAWRNSAERGERAGTDQGAEQSAALWAALQLAAPVETAAGSNAFAVAAERSATGRPLLAGDPHLKADAPAAWMEMHLRCPDLNVTGATLPGLPNVLAGRNERVAWAITSSQADVADCYLERVDRTTDRYLTPAGWVPLRRRVEVVGVRGESDRRFTVEETRHGSVVSDLGSADQVLSVRWVHTEVPSRHRPLEAMNEASCWPQFRDALSLYSGVGLSVVYADADGVIARQQAGPVPDRCGGRPEDRILRGWSSADDWRGLVPFEALPVEVNPTSGVVCAANDDPGPGSDITGLDWDWSGRADRARALLTESARLTTEDLMAVQLDLFSPMAARLRRALLAARPDDANLAAVLSDAAAWDQRYDTGSAGAAVFARWYPALARELQMGDDGDPDLVSALESTRTWWSCRGAALLIERVAGLAPEDLVAVSTRALRAAARELTDTLGARPWTFGQLSATYYEHVLGPAFSVGPVPLPGGVDSLWRGDPSGNGRGVPTLRQVFDLADPDAGFSAVCPGNSGVPGDPHYADQVEGFLAGRLHPCPLSAAATAEIIVQTLTLTRGRTT